jgi:cell shape-determining protein MreC
MSYHQDKRIKIKKIQIIILVIIFLFLFLFFRAGISKNLSYFSHSVFKPVLVLGKNISNNFSNLSFIFSSKKKLLEENRELNLKLNENEFRMINYNSILNENIQLKEILNRKKENISLISATILTKPRNSIYNTLIIDIGYNQGILLGKKVFAWSNIPIGYIAEVEANSSKVILYSSPGEKTEVFILNKNIFMEITGRGGSNFEMILPKDLFLENGTEIFLPGTNSYLIAKVSKIISDSRDSLQKAILISPVNIQELKFVQVEK